MDHKSGVLRGMAGAENNKKETANLQTNEKEGDMNTTLILAFFIGMLTGIGGYLAILEIGYRKVVREDREDSIDRQLDAMESLIRKIEKRTKRIDFDLLKEGGASE